MVAHRKILNSPRFSVQVAIKNWSSSFKNAVYSRTGKSAEEIKNKKQIFDATHRKSAYFGALCDASN
jgi:hypothetical protein